MSKKIIHLVMAARPNMMKVAPLYHALKDLPWADVRLVHTGQHYDDRMFGAFLKEFNLPEPHHQLQVGSGTHAEQTGRTMIAYEALLLKEHPDLCVVVGDVNATIACAISAKKQNVLLAHLEAGLRSFDRTMPEEINRLATDAICDYYWTPSHDATAQLIKEGIAPARILEAGNIMIDTYCMLEDRIKADDTRTRMGLTDDYAVMTMHRAGNVDDKAQLARVAALALDAADVLPVVFPVHPRTASKLEASGAMAALKAHTHLHLCDPLSYVPFLNLVSQARMVLTDSGGVQEETSYLGIPCLTLRTTTERPITVSEGTNTLSSFANTTARMRAVMAAPKPIRPSIKGWDGRAAQRIAAAISQILNSNS